VIHPKVETNSGSKDMALGFLLRFYAGGYGEDAGGRMLVFHTLGQVLSSDLRQAPKNVLLKNQSAPKKKKVSR
jgi:hypothetical protein